MKFQALKYAMRLGSRESFVQGTGSMRRKVVHHHADPLRVRVMDIGQIAHAIGEVPRGPVVRHFHMTPGFVRIEEHEQIGYAITSIFAIVSFRLTWASRDRLAHFA